MAAALQLASKLMLAQPEWSSAQPGFSTSSACTHLFSPRASLKGKRDCPKSQDLHRDNIGVVGWGSVPSRRLKHALLCFQDDMMEDTPLSLYSY